MMKNELDSLIQKNSRVQVGLAAHRLSTGEEILINADAVFHPASTIKVCVMMEVFRQARQGRFGLDEPMRVKNEFASLADGSPYALSIEDDSEKDLYDRLGQTLPVRELVERMITVSSNLATNILIERVTPERTTAFMRELGAKDVLVRRGVEDNRAFRQGLNNSATARGLMQILVKLAKREVVSPQDSDEMIEILSRQQFNEMVPAGLPPGARVAHKTGWTGKFYHDVGIVYPPEGSPFVLAIMTEGFEKQSEAHMFLASIGKIIATTNIARLGQ